MRILVSKLVGEALVTIFNKNCEVIHQEEFSGKFTGGGDPYERAIPVKAEEYLTSQVTFIGEFEYRVSE